MRAVTYYLLNLIVLSCSKVDTFLKLTTFCKVIYSFVNALAEFENYIAVTVNFFYLLHSLIEMNFPFSCS